MLDPRTFWRGVAAWSIMLAAASWVHLARRSHPGLQRLLVTLPALAAMYAAPLLFDFATAPFSATAAAFLCMRMTGGKVLAFILGRGALTLPLSYAQLVTVMLAPFMPAELATGSAPQTAGGSSSSAQGGTGSGLPPVAPAAGGPRSPAAPTWIKASPVQRFSIDSSSTTATPSGSPKATPSAAAGRGSAAAPPPPSRLAPSNGLRRDQAAASATSAVLSVAVCAAFAVYCCHSAEALAGVACHLTGMWVMWRAMELVMAAASSPARTGLGMALAPHFLNPFRSTSLTDFWARRWNITQGLVLRYFVFQPIVEGRLVAATPTGAASAIFASATVQGATVAHDAQSKSSSLGSAGDSPAPSASPLRQRRRPHAAAHGNTIAANSGSGAGSAGPLAGAAAASAVPLLAPPSAAVAPRWRRQLAAAATFVVSGLEHELFLWYLTRSWDGRWLAFFSLQGLLLAAEAAVKRAARAAGVQLHPVASCLGTLLVLGLTADAFFWPPLVQPALVQPLRQALPQGLGLRLPF